MVNIAVFVSGGGTNLQAIIDAWKNNEINGNLKLVVSNRKKAYGLERAKQANIKAVEDEEINLIVLAGYLAIVSERLIEKYQNKIINIHPSLIPSFCGPGYYGIHVHEEAFKRGVKVSGATVHFVSAVVDGGPIILQKSIDISDCDSPEAIQLKILNNIEHQLIVEAVKLYCDNRLVVKNERVEII